MAAKGLGSNTGKTAEIRLRVCGWIGWSDRGFEGNRCGRAAGFGPTDVVGMRLRKEKMRSGRSEGAQRRGRDAGKGPTGAVGPQKTG